MRTAILLLKANPYHDAKGRFARAPEGKGEGEGGSATISTEAGARAYWRRHFAAARHEISIAFGERVIQSAVEFDPGNDHAYTKGSRDERGRKSKERAFSLDRARRMDAILETIAAPDRVLDHHGSDLFIEKKVRGEHYVIVLRWRDARNAYEFQSAYPITVAELADLRRRGAKPTRPRARKQEAPLHKGGALSSAFLEFDSSVSGQSGASQRPPGGTSRVSASPTANIEEADALFKALPAGARWITVRPNGPGTDGHPVLIQPSGDGSMRVIGGAGGKLNYLKLTGVRSEEEYAARAKEAATERRQKRREQARQDREAGLAGMKQKTLDQLRLSAQAARDEFIHKVGAALGWKEEDTRFRIEDHQDKPASEVEAAQTEHARRLYDAAEAAVQAQKDRILLDADLRSETGIPLVAPPDDPQAISVADLDPVATGPERGLGFLPKYDSRAAAGGATPEDIRAEAAEVTGRPVKPADEKREADTQEKPREAADKPDIGTRTAEALDTVREPIPGIDPQARASAAQAMEVLRAQREMREKLKQVRARAKEVEKAATAGEVQAVQAFVIEVGGKAVAEEVVRGIEDDLRTIRTRGFLAEAQKSGAAEARKHVAVGAYNAVNSLALAAGGAALLDRSVVDVLGPAGAAQALAHRLAADLPAEEMSTIQAAMGRYHVEHYMARSRDALDEARGLQEQAAEIELGEAQSGDDLALVQELNGRRRDLIRRSQAILAQALGEMETNAALVAALEKPKRDRITVPMGDLAPTDAITRLRAIGLDRGDYTIERAGRNTILVIRGEAIGKLSQPVDAEDLKRVNRNIAIMQGQADEDGWLPMGVARRTAFGKDAPMGVSPRLARAFPTAPGDVGQAVRDYIGGRAADGDAPADIVAGLLSEETIQKAGDRDAFMAAVNAVAPLYDKDGKLVRAEAHAEGFEHLADEFVAREYGTDRAPIHRQPVTEDDKSVEALHRALASTPEAVLGWKTVGDLTPQDQRALRQFFGKEFATNDPQAQAKRDRLAELDAKEPEKEADGLFGRQANPEWTSWKAERDAAAQDAAGAELTWNRYVTAMGGPAAAYQAMQDVVRGRAVETFAQEHNKLRPDAPLRLGRTVIRGDLSHLDALDPAARERRQAEHTALVDRLRTRIAGRYASGSVTDKVAAAREAEEAANQAQMGLFGAEPAAAGAAEALPENTAPLGAGERWTVGHAAERTLAGMVSRTAGMWKPGQPVNLFAPDMSGRYIARQRAVKLIDANGRVLLGMGMGSGKTSIMLGAFTHLKEQGKATRGLFLVPSVVQGQFHGEALTMLQPGRYSWHANPGASREERIAALKDPNHDFVVMTHQSFRDDLLHLAATHAGVDPEAMSERLSAMTPEERAETIRDTLAREGIDASYLAIDEGHNLLNRRGKENSRMADLIDAVSRSAKTYVSATADPVKNDASEVFDTLQKMDPQRYSDRDAFMRRYGVDTEAAREGLRRELARHYYTASIDPGVAATRREITVPLHAEDRARIDAIKAATGAARLARLEGRVDIAAARTLSPGSFENVPPEQHEAVARKLQEAIGVVRDSAMSRALSGRGKADALSREAAARKGRPGVVFAHHLDTVDALADRLRREGHRVVTLTGKHGAKEKDAIKRAFQRGEHDILVASDAAMVGANLQAGKWLAQFDTPQTAMAHAQRNGRIHRIGQTEEVELLDLVADHPDERRARDRLSRKYGLREIVTSPLDSIDDTGLAGLLQRMRAGRVDAEPDLPEEPAPRERAAAAVGAREEEPALF